MNRRTKAKSEIIRNLDGMSLQELFLDSQLSKIDTNLFLAQILNKNHIKKVTTCCLISDELLAA